MGLNMPSQKEKPQKKLMIYESKLLFEEAVSSGIIQSNFYLGEIYENGEGLKTSDFKKAVEHYQKAADGGYPRAYFQLAKL